MDTPIAYARYLATYIASPTKIEKLVLLDFDRAPPLHVIANLRYTVEREKKAFGRDCYRIGNSATDGEDFRPRSLLGPPPPRVRTATVPPLPFDTGNPFLQLYRLTRAVSESVGRDFELPVAMIMGSGRLRDAVNARAVVINLLLRRGLGHAEIGRRLGKDHSTIIHARKNFDLYMRRDERIAMSWARHLVLAEEADRELDRRAELSADAA